jgi:hypothetical protein
MIFFWWVSTYRPEGDRVSTGRTGSRIFDKGAEIELEARRNPEKWGMSVPTATTAWTATMIETAFQKATETAIGVGRLCWYWLEVCAADAGAVGIRRAVILGWMIALFLLVQALNGCML